MDSQGHSTLARVARFITHCEAKPGPLPSPLSRFIGSRDFTGFTAGQPALPISERTSRTSVPIPIPTVGAQETAAIHAIWSGEVVENLG